MRTAIYCRVSTDDQDKEGTSLQTQQDACLAYCNQKRYHLVRQYTETYSGLTLDRPKLNQLRELIRSNDLDILVIYCLDRLSRNATHGVILRDELDKHGVILESVTEDIDKSPLGEAITYLRGTFAQIEAEKIRERTMRGKLALIKQGKLPQGTGIGIYGYDLDKITHKRTINEHEAKTVQNIFNMAIQGFSFNRIAIELNKQRIKTKSGSLWYPLTIRRILNNPTYTGKTYYGMSKRVAKNKVIIQPKEKWILLPDVTPPIITLQTFDLTQEAIRQTKQSRPVKPNAKYLLTSFIKCSKCGSPIIGTTLNGKYRYYKCRGSFPTATRDKICDAGYIKARDLDISVCRKLIEMLSSPLTLLRTLNNQTYQEPDKVSIQLTKQINNLRKKLKAYPRKEKTLYDLISNELVTKDYVLDTINKLKHEQLNAQHQLKLLLQTRKETQRNNLNTLQLSTVCLDKLRQLDQYFPFSDTVFTPDMDDFEKKLDEHIAEVFQRRRLLFESINLKILADPTGYEFTFTLDGAILSTKDSDDLSFFDDELRDFEELHPDISIQELLDPKKTLPENTSFAKKVNQLKRNLVTTEQTSA